MLARTYAGAGRVGIAGLDGLNFNPNPGPLDRALFWVGTDGYVDLHPAGYSDSFARAARGGQQVGWGTAPGLGTRALLWGGTPASVVSLHPADRSISRALGVGGGQQVGDTYTGFELYQHAALWTGTAASYVDLNPAGQIGSTASDTDGVHQVGSSLVTRIDNYRAAMWSGTADSYVDLTPAGFTSAGARRITGGRILGQGWGPVTGDRTHPLVWRIGSEGYTDLYREGWGTLYVSDMNERGFVVGAGTRPGSLTSHALLWEPDADGGYILRDLHSLLPSTFRDSAAASIDDNGVIYGSASLSLRSETAFALVPIPEPSAACLLGVTAAPVLLRRRRD